MRTKAVVLFPHDIIANSPSQPVWDTSSGKFGPFEGQLFVGEMNEGRLIRVMLEKVGGEFQGACIPFFDNKGLRKGNNRLAFAPDGSLWVGQNSHGWLGDEGIQRIVFNKSQPFDIYTMSLTESGFDLVFTKPIKNKHTTDSAAYSVTRYYYEYHKKYGSDRIGSEQVAVKDIHISSDRKKVSLTLSELKPGYVYELKLNNIFSHAGDTLENKIICYTLNRLRSEDHISALIKKPL